MVNRFKDFDAAWAETVSPSLSVKVYGETYTLPAALPARVVLMLARMNADDPNVTVRLDQQVGLLTPFFGPGVLEKWADAGMDVDQMGDLFLWCMAMYRGEDPDAKPDVDDAADREGLGPNP